MKQTIKEHESYGMIQISRINGGNASLVGCNVLHGTRIALRISTASNMRYLNRDWFHNNKEIIEVELSPAQFAEMLTGMNTSGVPCTIKHVEGKRMESPPFENKMEEFDNEHEQILKDLANEFDALTKESIGILDEKKSLSKSDKETIKNALNRVRRKLTDNLPFIRSQFTESTDKTIHEAKVAIDSYHTHQIVSLGQEVYMKKLIDTEKDK